jgi:hypothetical protein
MNIQSTIALRSATQALVKVLDLMNELDEDDFREVVLFVREQEKSIKNVQVNIERGNLFMTLYFVRELLEQASRK